MAESSEHVVQGRVAHAIFGPYRTELWMIVLLALAVAVVGWARVDWRDWLSSEEGPVEMGAALLWVLCALQLWWGRRPSPGVAVALGVVCVGLAVREYGLPAHWVPSGKALLMLSHYTDGGVSLLRRSVEALVVSGFLWSLAVSSLYLALAAWRGGPRLRLPGRLFALGAVSLVVAQGLEAGLGESGMLLEELLECAGAWCMWMTARASQAQARACAHVDSSMAHART